MKPGQIVTVDWRDAIPAAGEPNKVRPGISIGSPQFYDGLPFKLIVPLSGSAGLALHGAHLSIAPTSDNGCTKVSYALTWQIQCVSHLRLTETSSRITDDELATICAQVYGLLFSAKAA